MHPPLALLLPDGVVRQKLGTEDWREDRPEDRRHDVGHGHLRSAAKTLEPTKYSSKVAAVKPPLLSVRESRLHFKVASQFGATEDPETGAVTDGDEDTESATAVLAVLTPSAKVTEGIAVGASPVAAAPAGVPTVAPAPTDVAL